MQKLHSFAQNIIKKIDCIISRPAFLIVKSALGDLDIPVAEIIPEEINDLAQCNAKFIVIDINGCF